MYNGDDFALGIIIRLMKVQHATATLHASDITDYTLYVTKILLPEAAQRKYEHIGSRIMTELLPWLTRESVTTHVNPGTTDMSLNSHNELFASEYYTTRKRSAKEDQPAVELRESSVFQKCTVDTVHIDLLTPAKFRAQYVRRNEPVLIQVGNSSLLNHLAGIYVFIFILLVLQEVIVSDAEVSLSSQTSGLWVLLIICLITLGLME